MDVAHILADAFQRIRAGMHAVTDGLDADALAYRPDAGANSIAWLVWHATRVHDDHVAEIAGREQAWVDAGWAQRFGLPFDRGDTGYGHTAAQVANVRPADPALLTGYHEDVAQRTFAYLADLDPSDLDRIIDYSYDPPVSVGVRLVSVINDQVQHLGQAAYLRGMLERRSSIGDSGPPRPS